jgi:hypothetical protein
VADSTTFEDEAVYFKVWHPLFPFMHGPTFLQAMEKVYSSRKETQHKLKLVGDWIFDSDGRSTSGASKLPRLKTHWKTMVHTPGTCKDHRSTCWTIVFQCVFNLGSLLAPDVDGSDEIDLDS